MEKKLFPETKEIKESLLKSTFVLLSEANQQHSAIYAVFVKSGRTGPYADFIGSKLALLSEKIKGLQNLVLTLS